MIPGRLLWLARRARNMSAKELSYRLAHAGRGTTDLLFTGLRGKSLYERRYDAGLFAFCQSTTPLLPELEWEFSPTAGTVKEWLAGRHEMFGFPWRWEGEAAAEDWHRAPDTCRIWPRRHRALINYRPGNDVGDARSVWEPNRLQHLVSLALITRLLPEHAAQASQGIKRRLLCWLAANPAQQGVNYASALECALRILSVSFASDLARPYLTGRTEYWAAASKLILEHAAIISDQLSLFSSLGNHTIGECTGLLVAALLFPEAREADAWERRASTHLITAARAVILHDGGPAEQAFHYHAQVIDYLHIAVLVGRHFGRDMSKLSELRRAGARFLARFGSRRDQLPNIGDNDEGHVLSAHMVPSWAALAHECTGVQADADISCFTAGGYSRIHSVSDDVELIMDHGPLGFPPNFAHGHADALGLHLRVAGRPVLVDGGTSLYGAEPEWRSFCRDTAAHNCITVDDRGQAKQTGPFLWSGSYDCRLLHADTGRDFQILVGRHLGYKALGVVHTRAVLVGPRRIVVLDRVSGGDEHRLTMRWHFASRPVRDGEFYTLTDWSGFRCRVFGGTDRILHGSLEPRGGWLARRYGQMIPGWTLESSLSTALPHEFGTAFLMPSYVGDPRCTADFSTLRVILDQIDAGLTPPPSALPSAVSHSTSASLLKQTILVDG
jgi:hypothetical protein